MKTSELKRRNMPKGDCSLPGDMGSRGGQYRLPRTGRYGDAGTNSVFSNRGPIGAHPIRKGRYD